MSKAEILAELPKLEAHDRAQIFRRLCELQDDDLVRGGGPTEEEKQVLDQALAEFERDGDFGTDWQVVLKPIRSSNTR
jgi:hypothetical protein